MELYNNKPVKLEKKPSTPAYPKLPRRYRPWQTRKWHRFNDNPAEEAFVRVWREQNSNGPSSTTRPDGTIRHIVDDSSAQNGMQYGVDLDDDQLQMAEEIIQWLGTPIGLGFIGEVLAQIPDADCTYIIDNLEFARKRFRGSRRK